MMSPFSAACPAGLLPRRLATPAVGIALLASAFGAQAQQWTQGQTLWNDGKPGAGSCVSCHAAELSTFRNRFATSSVADTRARIQAAAGRVAGMAVAFNAMSDAEKNQVAAFVADIRAEANVSANPGPVLAVGAAGQSASTTLTLFNTGRAPLTVVTNNGVRLSGAGATQFTVSGIGSGCLAMTLMPGGNCQVRVTYQPQAGAGTQHAAVITFEHNGEPQASTTLALSGSISASPAPAPTPPPPAGDSGGGGALPLAAWAALLPLALLARRRTR